MKPAITYWLEALNEPYGVWIKTTDVERLKPWLYCARRDSPHSDALSHLQLRRAPSDPWGTMWIVNPGQVPTEEDEP